jgi:tetratricopeptide (TPR) repeat protein
MVTGPWWKDAGAIACVLISMLPIACGRSQRGSPAADTREAAYRANNLGVGLLEQFAYDRAIAAFREALQIDPAVRLARINLAIASFYAGRVEEAAANARAAQEDYPEAPEPAYLLGLIARAGGQPDEAIRQFERVLEVDPDDAGARINLAMTLLDQRRYQEAATLAESALDVEPYNATAAYTAAMAVTRMGDAAAAARALLRFEQLRAAPYAITYSQSYLEQGRYAEALASTGAEAGLATTAMPAVTFSDVTTTLLGTAGGSGGPATGAVTLADVDGDGDLDLVGGGASLRLLRNDRSRFVDISAAAFPSPLTGIVGIAAGDLNNDQRADLLALTLEAAHLLVQDAEGRFLTAQRLDGPRGRARTGALADTDHDGDLDVLLAGTVVVVLQNNGNGTFTDVTAAARFAAGAGVVAVTPTDFDNRRDIDFVLAATGRRPMVFRNLRTGAFEDVGPLVGVPGAADYTSMAAGDVNTDGFTDLLLGRESAPAVWMLSERAGRYRATDASAATRGLTAAQLFDYDNDGLVDVFAFVNGRPSLFRNAGGEWREHAAALAGIQPVVPPQSSVPAVAAGDLDLDGDTDVVGVFRGGGLRIWRNEGGNANRSVRVALTGRASNRAGLGAKVEVRAGSLYQRVETASATPPVTPADITIGLGRRPAADAIRVLWPSGVLQTEIPEPATGASVARIALTELDRRPSSCPYLFTWNGERFEFVTDFLGGGEMGYLEAPPAHRNTPDPDEYVRIADTQLRERNGRFEIRVTNELEEVLFLDHVALLPVAHPADAEVFPDEGLRLRPAPLKTYIVRQAHPPRAALDEHGHDVLASVSHRDRRFVDDFALAGVRGYAREHTLTLDLASAPRRSARERTVLLLTGWTDYAFSSDNVSAHQAGLTLVPPALQVETSDGTWETVTPDVGIPVGRPQTLVVDVTPYASRRVRILTSMRVYWDQILVGAATSDAPVPVPVSLLGAELRWRGFSKEVSFGGHPLSYDYRSVSPATPWKLMPGRYTREGDVQDLLGAADDRFVISRPGDEVVLSFDASALPPLAEGMRRTFLLYSVGFSKEMDLHSASPDGVLPIPFRAMRAYPFSLPERYPHPQDLETFHTRTVPRAIPTLLPEESR